MNRRTIHPLHNRGFPLVFIAYALSLLAADSANAAEGRITLPTISGRAEMRTFDGHPGWVDVYRSGYRPPVSARIDDSATFQIPDPDHPVCLIATFDKIETPPVIIPGWPVAGNHDVPIPVEYACIPPGYPEVWTREYERRADNFWQTFVAKGTQLYGVSVFDGPKIVDWGNKINLSVHEDRPNGSPIVIQEHWDGKSSNVSAGHSDHEMPRVGWRHGDIPTTPGRTYAVRIGGYHSHGGQQFKLDAYVRPDTGDGYAGGEAFADGTPTGGDLCCLIFGNAHGQYVEHQIRSEEWEIFIPKHRPTTIWAQSFVPQGVSLAGVVFWAGARRAELPQCEIRIREEGPWGKILRPVKVAQGHPSPERPIIRYPDTPSMLADYAEYYELPSVLFQVAYMPDEMPLKAGKEYCIELVFSNPVMMYADGDFYKHGYAHYEGLQVDQQWHGHMTKHSERWSLAMTIVTYGNREGAPLDSSP